MVTTTDARLNYIQTKMHMFVVSNNCSLFAHVLEYPKNGLLLVNKASKQNTWSAMNTIVH